MQIPFLKVIDNFNLMLILLIKFITGSLILFFIFYKFVFLRDNKNRIPKGDNIVSPASGKVINLSKVTKTGASLGIKKGFFGHIKTALPDNEEYYLLNIFMNVANVHFTKMPCKGKVIEIIKRPGKFLAVMSVKNAIENEKQEFILETRYGTAKVIQIAGLIARRCVSAISPGDSLEKGGRLGQILFGSQVALLIPSKNLTPTVKVGDKVSAGESILLTPKS